MVFERREGVGAVPVQDEGCEAEKDADELRNICCCSAGIRCLERDCFSQYFPFSIDEVAE